MELYYFSSGPRERVLQAVATAGHKVREVLVSDPARWPKTTATVALAQARGFPVRVVGRQDLMLLADELRGRICLSVGFAYLFPPQFVESVEICLNVHGSLLPRYAGARTLNWIIERGETESGITVHRVDAGVDTGPILLQRSFPLSPFETGRSLYRKTLELEPGVVVEALALYESGQATFRPQNLAGVNRWPDRVAEHSELDPRLSLLDLYNNIRAADPERYPAYFYVAGQKVCVRLWRPEKSPDEADAI
jgi:methionyl-tRNA formyltransferase